MKDDFNAALSKLILVATLCAVTIVFAIIAFLACIFVVFYKYIPQQINTAIKENNPIIKEMVHQEWLDQIENSKTTL